MDIYLSLCEAVRDISGVQRHLSTLRSLRVFLPEILDAALRDRVPSFLRRELTKALIAIVDDRGGKFPDNAKALGDILRGDDYRPSAEGATHTLRRFEGTEAPSSLEAFCHLFDRCGDMTTQVNVAKAFVLVVKHGEIDQELIARFLGQNLRENFSALVRGVFLVDEFRELLYALVGEYDVSRGSSASALSVVTVTSSPFIIKPTSERAGSHTRLSRTLSALSRTSSRAFNRLCVSGSSTSTHLFVVEHRISLGEYSALYFIFGHV